MSFHATDAGFSARTIRLSTFRKHLMSGVCAGLIITAAGSSAHAQQVPSKYFNADGSKTSDANAARASWRTPEFLANWGLKTNGFDAAYAAGATGQGVKVGVLDSGTWAKHFEFAKRQNVVKFGAPFLDGDIPGVDRDENKIDDHGTHVGGIIAANRDGIGMHGGAFDATLYVGNNKRPDLGEPGAKDAIVNSGVVALSNSWGWDFRKGDYRQIINVDIDGQKRQAGHGPDIFNVIDDNEYSARKLDSAVSRKRMKTMAEIAGAGTTVVFSAGNDRYYSASYEYNHNNARPRLFRGSHTTYGYSMLPSIMAARAANSQYAIEDVQRFHAVEKNFLNIVMLNSDEKISHYSAICGTSKYYCVGAAGGTYEASPNSYTMATPSVPEGVDIETYLPGPGKKYLYSNVENRQILSDYYRIFSTGVKTTAPDDASDEAKRQNLKANYVMMFGTSMATPTANAAEAVIKSRFPYLTNTQVRDTLLSTAKDVGAPGIDRVYGWGSIDLAKAMSGPAKFWQLKASYDPTLTEIEKRAAEKYNPIVAKADYWADLSYETKNTANALRNAGKSDEAQHKDAEAKSYSEKAFSLQLTDLHPNEEQDTEDAAFEYYDFRVNIPGVTSESCPNTWCVADAWTNDINGPGGLTKLGKGALALAGTNSYRGGTTIDEGVVQLGLGGTTGSVAGNIVNNGTLAYYRSNEWVMRKQISGSGKLEVFGGTLRLAGTNTYTGETSINGGLLAVDGSIASIVSVNAGGELGGIGTVGGLAVHAGGMVSPGNSIGTLHVAGPATFDKATGLTIQVAADGRSDRLEVKGKATLLGGVLIVAPENSKAPLSPAETLALLGKTYTVLTAEKGVTGRFEAATPDYYFIGASLAYAPGDVKVSLARNGVAFADAGQTRNQKAAATGVESLGASNPLYDTIAVTTLAENLPEHFDALSGEVHASLQAVLVEDSRFVRDAAANRIRAAFGNMAGGKTSAPALAYGPDTKKGSKAAGEAFVPLLPAVPTTAFWGEAYGSRSHADGTSNASAYSRNTGGFVTGFDGVIADTWRFGLLAGYGNTSVNTARGHASADSYQVGVYGGTRFDALTLSLGTSLAHHQIDTRRKALGDSNTADYSANTVQLFGEAAYRIDTAYAALEPFAAAAYTHLKTDGFTETGGKTALSGQSDTTDLTTTTLGLRASHRFVLSEATALTARGMAGWRHAFGDTTPEASLAFASGGQAFPVHGLPIASDTALVEAGLDFGIGKATTLGLSYTGQFSQQTRDNAVKADLTVRF